MENRVEQNENQISRLNLLIHNELERTDPISKNLHSLNPL
jgi:hypothetical protein